MKVLLMRPRSTEFVISAVSPGSFPSSGLPEVAFAGRSNVGKSSLINALTGVRGLARTSGSPGRTRALNWFQVDAPLGRLMFVDLPGYGYAQVSKSSRAAWQPLVEGYIKGRSSLRLVVLILDLRRGPEADDRELVEWLTLNGRRVSVVLTKADKLGKAKRFPLWAAARRALGLDRDPIIVSSQTGEGLDDVWHTIRQAVQAPGDSALGEIE